MGVSPTQMRVLRELVRFGGEMNPDAELAAGCFGAAFAKVRDALINKGLVDETGMITDAGSAIVAWSGFWPGKQGWLEVLA